MRLNQVALVACLCVLTSWAAEFRTINGDVYSGEIAAADPEGLLVRLKIGGFSPRIDWAKLDDPTLKQFVDDKRARRFVEPMIEPPIEEVTRIEARKIEVRQPVRAERLAVGLPNRGLIAALTTPSGLLFLGLLFLSNLYAGYEIARFKWRSVPLVCGFAAVFPIFGPLIFLILPRRELQEEVNATEEAASAQQLNVPSTSAGSGASSGGATSLARQASGGGGEPEGPKVFRRGETTFNRRFFETQFPSFFRVIATEADKDLLIEVTLAKGKVLGSRVSRISSTEVHFRTPESAEVGVEFSQMIEVKLRNKMG